MVKSIYHNAHATATLGATRTLRAPSSHCKIAVGLTTASPAWAGWQGKALDHSQSGVMAAGQTFWPLAGALEGEAAYLKAPL